jgi:uncharacterized membrane protein YjjP (DUF1212 family)
MNRLDTQLLTCAGRLLLEYNESTGEIQRALTATGRALTDEEIDVVVSYGGVAVSVAGEPPLLMRVRELRYNVALQARVHGVLRQVRQREIETATALDQLKDVEANTPRHARWLVVLILGAAAASLARLLGADTGAIAVAGLSTSLGLLARQQLGRLHFNLLTLPLVAALIGAVLGGLAMRFGWTVTPGLALIVPSLMLIPGPHLINGLLDLIDNHIPMALARLGLAASIVVASALGIIIGMELTLWKLPIEGPGVVAQGLNVFSDMFLAGIVTMGFACFYNAAWAHVGLAIVGGMAGHGLRFLVLEAGWRLEAATFVGGLVVGLVAAWIARSSKIPVAVIAFAGAVTMMPGIQIYRALGGSLQLARTQAEADLASVASTLGFASQACLVVGALSLGLVVGARIVPMSTGEQDVG